MLVDYDSQVLKTKAESVTDFSSLHSLIVDLKNVIKRESAFGAAAPQIGVSKSVVVVDPSCGSDESKSLVLINAKYEKVGEDTVISREGCLSLPNVVLNVTRNKVVKVTYQNLSGEQLVEVLDGQTSIICQHEIDHLNGVLIIDKASRHDRRSANSILKKGKNRAKK